jgi:hypothetical protein
LPLEIPARQQELVSVADVGHAAGRSFHGGQGHRLTLVSVQPQGRNWTLRFRLSGPRGWSYSSDTHAFELVDARGRVVRFPALRLASRPLFEPRPEDVAWLAAAPQAPSLLQLPWLALALHDPGDSRRQWFGTLSRLSPFPLEAPVSLRLYRFERLWTELPFELRDLPTP